MPCIAFASTISITGNDYTDITKTDRYQAYQIFSGEVSINETGDKVISNVDWGSGILDSAKFLNELKASGDFKDAEGAQINPFEACVTAADVAQVLADTTLFNTGTEPQVGNTQIFARIAANNKSTVFSSSTEVVDKTFNIPIDSAGYYLIYDNNTGDGVSEISANILVVTGAEDTIEINVKSAAPGFDKTIIGDNRTFSIEDEIAYTLTATLPDNFNAYSTYYLDITDVLPDGLTYTGADPQIAIDNILITDTSAFLHFYTDAMHLTPAADFASAKSFSFTFPDLKTALADYPMAGGSVIKVVYKAKLNAQATIAGDGNTNTATFTFSNNPNITENPTTDTITDTETVYSTELDLNKHSDSGDELQGAGFVLGRTKPAAVETEKFGGDWNVSIVQDEYQIPYGPYEDVVRAGGNQLYARFTGHSPTGFASEIAQFTITFTTAVPMTQVPQLKDVIGYDGYDNRYEDFPYLYVLDDTNYEYGVEPTKINYEVADENELDDNIIQSETGNYYSLYSSQQKSPTEYSWTIQGSFYDFGEKTILTSIEYNGETKCTDPITVNVIGFHLKESISLDGLQPQYTLSNGTVIAKCTITTDFDPSKAKQMEINEIMSTLAGEDHIVGHHIEKFRLDATNKIYSNLYKTPVTLTLVNTGKASIYVEVSYDDGGTLKSNWVSTTIIDPNGSSVDPPDPDSGSSGGSDNDDKTGNGNENQNSNGSSGTVDPGNNNENGNGNKNDNSGGSTNGPGTGSGGTPDVDKDKEEDMSAYKDLQLAKFDERGYVIGWFAFEEAYNSQTHTWNDGFVRMTGVDGKIDIYGLGKGDYFLKEVITPSGFNTMADVHFTIGEDKSIPETFRVNCAIDGGRTDAYFGDSLSSVVTEGVTNMTLINHAGSIMPNTGGVGTIIFYMIGGLLLTTSILLLISRRKKTN